MRSFAAKLARFVNPAPEDVDPEDEAKSSASESENEEARAHYVEVGKGHLRDDEPEVGEKYQAVRASRGDLAESESEGESEESESESEEENTKKAGAARAATARAAGAATATARAPGSGSAISAILQKEALCKPSENTDDAEKGKAVHASMKIYESLLDARISLQKVVVASHGENLGDSESTVDALCDLMVQIETLRAKLGAKANPRKRSFEEMAQTTFELDAELAKRREEVLSKWSRKVQLSSGSAAMQGSSFKSLNQSASRQVESVLGDMERLLKRTQVNRSQYRVNGEVPDHSDEIFDDTDFYRQLLTELVERRMAETSADGDNLKWKVAKQSRGVKKARDTSASKGRRLRYDVQDKLVSFDAPRPGVFGWTDQQADELFASLLGVTISMDDQEPEAAAEPEEVGEFNLFG